MKTEPNDSAFAYGTDNYDVKGLTKREYFAAMAMVGLSVQAIADKTNCDMPEYNLMRAKQAVNHADALIKALNETQP